MPPVTATLSGLFRRFVGRRLRFRSRMLLRDLGLDGSTRLGWRLLVGRGLGEHLLGERQLGRSLRARPRLLALLHTLERERKAPALRVHLDHSSRDDVTLRDHPAGALPLLPA